MKLNMWQEKLPKGYRCGDSVSKCRYCGEPYVDNHGYGKCENNCEEENLENNGKQEIDNKKLADRDRV